MIKLKNKIRSKRKSSNNCDKASLKIITNNNLEDEFCQYRKAIKKELRKVRRYNALNAELNIKSAPKKFWTYFSSQNVHSSQSFFFNGSFFDKPEDIANEFARTFQQIYSSSDHAITPETDELIFCNQSELNLISDEELLIALDHLKKSLVCGPDGIPSFIYKECADPLLPPIKHILNLCLTCLTFPEEWKLSRITPIFKNGDRCVGENYRGISILSAVSKILEIILYNRIYPLFLKSVAPEQHGFMEKRSTVTNLLSFMTFVSAELEKNNEVHVVYFDFLKAFDRVDHNLLLKKLTQNFDLPPYLIRLLRSYLSGRKSYVLFQDVKSFCFSILSGVPQGANLGPLLFLLFINDLPACLNYVLCLLFADDLKIFRSISSILDMELLQKDINNVLLWSKTNQLPINEIKCKLMVFCRNKSRFDSVQYMIGNTVITPQAEVRDLGILFDSNLTFDNHIRSIIAEANRTLGFVIRSSHSFRELHTLVILYNSLVRSKLEYASIIWHGPSVNQMNKLEKVQKKFLRYLYYRKHGVYPHYLRHPVRTSDMQKEFLILSLKDRRDLNDALFLYRIFNNAVDSPEMLAEFNFRVPRHNSRQKETFIIPLNKSRFVSPASKLSTLFNDLCKRNELDLYCTSLNHFKRTLVQYFLKTY